MRSRHLSTSGNRFRFVVRVPRDIVHLFPTATIWKPVKAKDARTARLLADAWEYRTQQLFCQLRTGMLSNDLEKKLVALFLKQGSELLEARAKGQPIALDGTSAAEANAVNQAVEEGFAALASVDGLSAKLARQKRSSFLQEAAQDLGELIAERDTSLFEEAARKPAGQLLETYGIEVPAREIRSLVLPLMSAQRKLLAADSATLHGDWEPFERLKETAARDLELSVFNLKAVLGKYREYYLASKTRVKPGTLKDMEVELRVIEEILGNITLSEANTMESLTRFKKVLIRYPLNRQQRYGERPLKSILEKETNYQTINPKTANMYIARMLAVVEFALKARMVTGANVYRNERFQTETAAEEERSAYEAEDIVRLIDALCTQQLWSAGPPRPERFWIVLIALFHGLRLGNIIGLTKRDICQTDRGMWIFRLRKGKTKATVRPVAICDSLLLIGFLEWVQRLPGEILFQDSARSFSSWYNRHETQNGKPSLGFESRFVTTDPKKCLYSLRHSFGGNVFDVTGDFKIASDMLGHSTAHIVTSRYTKTTRTEALKEVTEKMHMEHIDLDRLEARAKELFSL